MFIHSIIKIIFFYKKVLKSNVLKLFKRNSVALKNIWIICTKPNNSAVVERKMQASLRNQTCYSMFCSMTNSSTEKVDDLVWNHSKPVLRMHCRTKALFHRYRWCLRAMGESETGHGREDSLGDLCVKIW